MIHVSDIKSADDAINRAVYMTVVHVVEALVRQEGLLLPDVYNYFLEEMNACAIIDTSSENKQVLTARWVLSNLTSSPQHHLSYVCKVRKLYYDTLLYRTNGDVLVALTNALHRLSNLNKQTRVQSNREGDSSATCTPHNTDDMQSKWL